MFYKKIIFVISFLIIFSSLFSFKTQEVKAMTTAEIQALIAQLQAQIAALQKQLTETQGQPAAWCYDFNVNLRIGDTGAAVCSLRTALQKEGFETEIEKQKKGVVNLMKRWLLQFLDCSKNMPTRFLNLWVCGMGLGF